MAVSWGQVILGTLGESHSISWGQFILGTLGSGLCEILPGNEQAEISSTQTSEILEQALLLCAKKNTEKPCSHPYRHGGN